MRTSPSIVPHRADQDTYLVLEDFGRMGCYWRQTDADNADGETRPVGESAGPSLGALDLDLDQGQPAGDL